MDILPQSVVEKDNRLQIFDQIVEINGFKVNNTCTSEAIKRAVKQLHPKVGTAGRGQPYLSAKYRLIATLHVE